MRAYVLAVVVLIAAGTFLYWQGILRQQSKDAIDYREVRERVQDATTDDRDDDAILDRLRGHAQ